MLDTPGAGAVEGCHQASDATGVLTPRPPAGSCAPTPDGPSRPASSAPDRCRSATASDPPTHRPSRRTDPPPATDASPAPAAHHPSPPAPRPSAPLSCDLTRPAPPPGGTSRSSHTPRGSPSLPPVSSCRSSRPRVDNNARPTTDTSGQNRGEKRWPPMGRNDGRQWGDSVAAYGEASMAAVTRVSEHEIPSVKRSGFGWPCARPIRAAMIGPGAGHASAQSATARSGACKHPSPTGPALAAAFCSGGCPGARRTLK